MTGLTFLQSPVLTKFILPFLLIFFIVFAVLEKTKIFANKQLNAFIAFIMGFIFVSAVFPKEIVGNLILFLAIALVVVFVVLLLWGFVGGEEGLKLSNAPKGLKWVIGIVIIISVVFAVFWAAGLDTLGFFDKIFHSSWSDAFWTNVFFVVIVAAALAVVISGGKPKT
jgi:hypothetical protein